ncbi:MAG: DNA adenine methylase, partial [Bacteroides sp.]
MKQHIAKPFIKWVGGKGQLISTFETLLPCNFSKIKDVTYIEPFVGGGAMFFYMLQRFPNIKKAIINDVNPNLVKAYSVVRDTPEALIQALSEIQKEYLSISEEDKRKEFYLCVRKRFNEECLSDVENTMLFIFLNRTCFNGLYRVNSKGKFNVPSGKYKNPLLCDVNTIYADSKLLQKVEIMNGDFEQIEQYVTDNTFVYFDPPYRPLDATSSFNSYAKESFNDSEQIRLKKFFDKLTSKQCLMMLSNSDCRGRNSEDVFFDELYKDYIIERVYASRSVNANPEKRG